jgi:HSP20 family protein
MVIKISGSSQRPEVQREQPVTLTPFRMFEDYFNNWVMNIGQARRSESFKPAVDVLEKDNNIIIRCELPGIEEKDLNLKLDGRTITIQGERKHEEEPQGLVYHRIESSYGAFSRSFDLPDSADTEKISAAFSNGILTITVKQKPEAQPRTIKVNT